MASSDSEGLKKHLARIADVAQEPGRKLPPSEGSGNRPLVSLGQSLSRVMDKVTNLKKYIDKATQQAMQKPSKDGLNIDENAAIRLYTMEWKPDNAYAVMN
jgi:hypothetical protein